MNDYLQGMKSYWDKRFTDEEKVWGDKPSRTAEVALKLFSENNVRNVLVPGSGYGRNTKLFSSNEFNVFGIEISPSAYSIATNYDPESEFCNASVMDVEFGLKKYDAIYCFNVLHLFRSNERNLFIKKCYDSLNDNGVVFFCVFSEKEASYGKGNEVEKNTFESKPGRPVHYFTEQDLEEHFKQFRIIENNLIEDLENHGAEGEHSHLLRYIFAQKNLNYEFDGEKYSKASKHQKEWGNKIISELKLKGNERVLDLGCGDGALTNEIADLVPNGSVVGIDASKGMIEAANQHKNKNLSFRRIDINYIEFCNEFDVIFSNAALHWVKNHNRFIQSCFNALKVNGFIRFNFACKGNCKNLIEVLSEIISSKTFDKYFTNFEFPWYMPDINAYTELLSKSCFKNVRVWEENADRYFENRDQMIKWIEQPSIVPYLAQVDEEDKNEFKDIVVKEMLKRTELSDGRCFESFRRINVYAEK